MFLNRKTIIYFAPHPTDELLTMGADILASLRQRHHVHVVLCTGGSGAKEILNNGESRPCDLTDEEFAQARDREFRDSCLALGLKSYHIHIPGSRSPEGSLTVSEAQRIIRNFLAICGRSAIVCTTAPNNGPSQHPDHAMLGRAAQALLNQGVIREARFFLDPCHYAQTVIHPYWIPVAPITVAPPPQAQKKTELALRAYSQRDPKRGRYAIGSQGAASEFKEFQKAPVSHYYTKWNEKAMTRLEQLKNQHRRWIKLNNQPLLFYSAAPCEPADLGSMELVHIHSRDMEGYKAFCEQYSVKLTDKNLQRIADGSSFWCLVSEDGAVLSSVWLAWQQRFYIGETDIGFDMTGSKTAILFNLDTNEALHSLLLRSVLSHAQGPDRYITYSTPDNTSSAKVFANAGFTFDGAKSASDNSLQEYLARAGIPNITRKYQMQGLRFTP